MGHFIGNEPVRISLPDRPEEWVEIKPRLSAAERTAILLCMADAPTSVEVRDLDAAAGPQQVNVRLERLYDELLQRGVVGWHLLDEDGKEIPFSPELLKRVDPEDELFDLVMQELVRRNPTLLVRGPIKIG